MANLTEAERLRGWLLYSRLLEQMEQDVPIAIPNAGVDIPLSKKYCLLNQILVIGSSTTISLFF